jgi:hypothetical protein
MAQNSNDIYKILKTNYEQMDTGLKNIRSTLIQYNRSYIKMTALATMWELSVLHCGRFQRI